MGVDDERARKPERQLPGCCPSGRGQLLRASAALHALDSEKEAQIQKFIDTISQARAEIEAKRDTVAEELIKSAEKARRTRWWRRSRVRCRNSP